MSETTNRAPEHQPERSAEAIYDGFKIAADNKKHWDDIKKPSLRNALRMALSGAYIEKGSANADNHFGRAKSASRTDLEMHAHIRIEEAVQDASKNVALNLPYDLNDIQIASHVQPTEQRK